MADLEPRFAHFAESGLSRLEHEIGRLETGERPVSEAAQMAPPLLGMAREIELLTNDGYRDGPLRELQPRASQAVRRLVAYLASRPGESEPAAG